MSRFTKWALVGAAAMVLAVPANAVMQVSTTDALSQYTLILSQAKNIRSEAILLQAQIASGTVNLPNALGWLQDMAGWKAAQAAQGSNSSLNAAVVNLQALLYNITTTQVTNDGAAEFTALGALITALRADFPKDASSHPLAWVLNADGTVTGATAAGSAFAGTNTALTAFLATVQ